SARQHRRGQPRWYGSDGGGRSGAEETEGRKHYGDKTGHTNSTGEGRLLQPPSPGGGRRRILPESLSEKPLSDGRRAATLGSASQIAYRDQTRRRRPEVAGSEA